MALLWRWSIARAAEIPIENWLPMAIVLAKEAFYREVFLGFALEVTDRHKSLICVRIII